MGEPAPARRVGPQPRRDIVVMGASAGGVWALQRLLAVVPDNLPAAVFVVLHLSETTTSRLAAVLDRSSALPVFTAQDDDRIQPGRVLVAPTGSHLRLSAEGVQLWPGPRENGVRPSIDVLFRSAAESHGRRVVSVVLTGLLCDGALGSRDVVRHGGFAIAQDPASAEYPSMPQQAIQAAHETHVADLVGIADALADVAMGRPLMTRPG